ncbi:SRPBCC family protein [Paenibacillus sp. MWE-103]|uniref:SRPBCC family protein n=1 Tax=Paenibacillus artemisiicola TaxID=1172618 RepID=A0ABS3WK06_9BACL|nr:SRPBCC family protein [Paenibacillus artemisiicola]MBO7748573.1 SRPBCC family protein [Paenibacillus artemisiicola]
MEELKYELYIGAKPEDVWRALVSPEGTKAIFFGCVLETTFEPGSPFAYVGPGNDGDRTVHVYGTVVDCEANKRMSYLEHPGPSYRDNHEALETRVALTLEPVGETVKLTLVNDLWPEGHPSYANTKQSWPMILSNIKTYAETGKTLDFGW